MPPNWTPPAEVVESVGREISSITHCSHTMAKDAAECALSASPLGGHGDHRAADPVMGCERGRCGRANRLRCRQGCPRSAGPDQCMGTAKGWGEAMNAQIPLVLLGIGAYLVPVNKPE
jgi:hypothetical protein